MPDMMGVVKEFSGNGRLTRGITLTFITSIPKNKNPEFFEEFRPFSMVNSISYRILVKCLAKRLSTVLPLPISPEESAFLDKRSILDEIMITNELIHSSKKNQKKVLVIKVDFRKAYDFISSSHLDQIWQRRGLEYVSQGERFTHLQFTDDTMLFAEQKSRKSY